MKMKTNALWLVFVLALIAACGGQPEEGAAATEAEPAPDEPVSRAVAQIEPKSDSQVTGTATFAVDHGEVTLVLEVQNAPQGEHAFHLHQTGDCSAPDGTSAGGHWNPAGHDHGKWEEAPFHLGDVGNLVVGDDGSGALTLSTDLWSIGTGANNDIVGRAVILHAGADDFTSQPTGAAGGRIGCGVIE